MGAVLLPAYIWPSFLKPPCAAAAGGRPIERSKSGSRERAPLMTTSASDSDRTKCVSTTRDGAEGGEKHRERWGRRERAARFLNPRTGPEPRTFGDPRTARRPARVRFVAGSSRERDSSVARSSEAVRSIPRARELGRHRSLTVRSHGTASSKRLWAGGSPRERTSRRTLATAHPPCAATREAMLRPRDPLARK